MKKWYKAVLVFVFLTMLIIGCSQKNNAISQYADKENWAYYPETLEHDVDVFFIAPTSGHEESFNMKMDDEKYKASFKGATTMEKGIYDTRADFYAPYYRQISLECYMLPPKDQEQYLQIAYQDVEEAFDYYIKYLNNGRPYILAGFSQGGDMIKRLLEHDENAGKNMIAAYAIGWNFPADEMDKYPGIKMAQGECDTGVVVSFCSEAPDYNEPGAIVPTTTIGINPLNWKTDGTVATKEENLGACFTNYSGVILNEIPALCGAYLDVDNRGTLKVTDITPIDYPAGLAFLEDGNYHLYDYQFFYRNLQQNVEKRIDAWFGK